jgi:RNA polymerase sigma-70 factor (ECF subfamily)
MSSIAIASTRWDNHSESANHAEKRFEALVAAHSTELFRYAYWLSGDRQVAEDLTQETLLRAWKALHKLENPGAAKGWLYTILRRENARRFERNHPLTTELPPDELNPGDRGYDTSTEAFALRRAIKELPEEYREPLLLQVIGGYSQQEIAEQLGISTAGAGTRLFRARRKLRAMLESDDAVGGQSRQQR